VTKNIRGNRQSRSRSKAPSKQTAAQGNREQGEVKWFNSTKGFGFITRDSGEDIFVHFRSIRGEGHRTLKDGERVDFVVTDGDKGLQADDVIAL
jgi:cold shock CspA family protein